jgi:hypothetical protein
MVVPYEFTRLEGLSNPTSTWGTLILGEERFRSFQRLNVTKVNQDFLAIFTQNATNITSDMVMVDYDFHA